MAAHCVLRMECKASEVVNGDPFTTNSTLQSVCKISAIRVVAKSRARCVVRLGIVE
ncbi:hypothetical protein ABHF54_05850 [Nitrosomonas europaea]|uniref:hypothetical protein n=1 Tax=Nitrosomonas europaea TaxID=915 RepID=UPI003264D170